MSGWVQLLVLVVILAVAYRPLGDYMARVTRSEALAPRRAVHLPARRRRSRRRAALDRLRRVAAGVLARVGAGAVPPAAGPGLAAAFARVPRRGAGPAFNTAASFVTNTNWQTYSGESTMGHLVQMAGLAVQNFVSAAVGIAVAVALIRGFVRRAVRHDLATSGSTSSAAPFGSCCRSRRARAVVLIVARRGAEPSPRHRRRPRVAEATPDDPGRPGGLPGGDQGAGHQRRRVLQRQLGASVREPEPAHELLRDVPAAGDPVRADAARSARWSATSRQGYACSPSMALICARRCRDRRLALRSQRQPAGARGRGSLGGGNMEGKEVRFGIAGLGAFAARPPGTSTGAVNSLARLLHRRSAACVPLVNMMLGEVAPGGVGVGAVRHARAGDPRRVHRRPDGRPHARVPGQEDRGRAR